jgi:hypothetical protein
MLHDPRVRRQVIKTIRRRGSISHVLRTLAADICGPGASTLIERRNQFTNFAFERSREANENCESRESDPPLHVADERVARSDHRCELLLGQAASEPQFTQMAAKNDAIAVALCHVGSGAKD